MSHQTQKCTFAVLLQHAWQQQVGTMIAGQFQVSEVGQLVVLGSASFEKLYAFTCQTTSCS
jgi:hypothetical protein